MIQQNILVIEDDEELRNTLCEMLRQDYLAVEGASSAENALSRMTEVNFDLIIVDIGLPGMDGYRFCANLHSQKADSHPPLIILSGNLSVEDKLLGFSVGASDYMSKPFDLRELKARIQIQLKKAQNRPDENHLEIGPFQIVANKQSVLMSVENQRQDLQLSPLEYRLLYFFLTHIDHVLSREQLLNQIWGNARFVNDRSVDAVISKLRQKLGPHSDLLQSVRGMGYRFRKPQNDFKKASSF